MKFQSKKGELSFSASEYIPAFEKNTKNVKVNINQTFPTFGIILDHAFQRKEILKKGDNNHGCEYVIFFRTNDLMNEAIKVKRLGEYI